MTLHLNPHLFFLLKEGEIVVWDYLQNQQFEINAEYFERIKFWASGGEEVQNNSKSGGTHSAQSNSIDEDLIEGGLLSKTPFPAPEWGWDPLSKMFHMGTQNIPYIESSESPSQWIEGYAEKCDTFQNEHLSEPFELDGEKVMLSSPDLTALQKISLFEAFKNRKTNRIFHKKSISKETLSTILFTTFGKFHGDTWEEKSITKVQPLGIRKTSPSGGSLHPIEAYVLIYAVDGITPGIYHYSVESHDLTFIKDVPSYKELSGHFYNQFYLENMAFGVFLVPHFDRCWEKYPHSRAYRIVLMDAGHLSQTFLLTATVCGLNTWLSAAFKDQEISDLLGVDGVTHSPLHFVAAGFGENSSLPKID